MSNQQASIKLSANIVQFKKQMAEAKTALQEIGKAKLSGDAEKRLKGMFSAGMAAAAKDLKNQVKSLSSTLEKTFNPEKAAAYAKRLGEVKGQLRDIEKLQKQMKSNDFGEAGGGGIGGALKGGMGKLLTGAAAAMGVKAAMGRRLEMGQDRMAIRELGSQPGSEKSRYGFTTGARRADELGIARSAGRNMSGAELSSAANQNEMFQRAYGVGTQQQNEAAGTARKAGGDGQKYVANTIGSAVAAHLEGSKIGEFLAASSSALDSLKEGVNVDTSSLNGFAAALSSMPFFKSDPERAFAAIANMSQAFSHGDRFQQAQAGRALSRMTGGAANAGDVALRREIGLFGVDGSTKEGKAFMNQAGQIGGKGLKGAMGAKGGDIINSMMGEAVNNTKGEGGSYRIQDIMQRMGLHGQGGMQIAMDAIQGKKIDSKKFENATKDPGELLKDATDKAAKNMDTLDGDILDLDATLSQVLDAAAEDIADPITKLTEVIKQWLDAVMGGHGAEIAGGVLAAGAVAATGAGLGAGGLIKKGIGGIKGFFKGGGGGGAAAAAEEGGQMALPGLEAAGAGAAEGAAGFGLGGLAVAGGLGVGLGYGGMKLADHFTNGGYSRTVSKPADWLYDKLHPDQARGTPTNMNMSSPSGTGSPAAAPGANLDDHKTAVESNTQALNSLTSLIARGNGRGAAAGGGGRGAHRNVRAVGK